MPFLRRDQVNERHELGKDENKGRKGMALVLFHSFREFSAVVFGFLFFSRILGDVENKPFAPFVSRRRSCNQKPF
jgi:hypothetical protein